MPVKLFIEESETKPAKKKRVLTDEQREKLKENLKKGRETALKNRQKKALVKKIDKEDDVKVQDAKIAKKILGKTVDTSDDIKSLKEELKELKANGGSKKEMDELKNHVLNLTKSLTTLNSRLIEEKNKKTNEPFKEAIVKKEPVIIEEKIIEKETPPEPPPQVRQKMAFISRSARTAGYF